jgi:altronate dehydratase small subunit
MPVQAFQIAASDNVATLTGELAAPGPVHIIGGFTVALVMARGPIARGHKIALREMAPGEEVMKFGAGIGRATCPIARGDWVHLHNLASGHDVRSGTLDLHSGAPTDMGPSYG